MKTRIVNVFGLLKENYIYLLSSFIIFVLIVSCAYVVTKDAFERRLTSEAVIISDLSETLIKTNFQNLKSSFYGDIFRIEKMLEETNDSSKIEEFIKISASKKILPNEHLEHVYIYGIINGKVYYSDKEKEILKEDIENSHWYKKTIASYKELVQNAPYYDSAITDKELISWSKELFKDNKSIGVINMAIPFYTFIKFYCDLAKFNGGYVVLADSVDVILGHPQEEFIGKHILKKSDSWQLFLEEENILNKKDVKNYQNKPAYIFKKDMFNKWRLYVVIMLEDYHNDLRFAIAKAFVVCTFCFLLLSFVLVRLNIRKKHAINENIAKSNFLAVISHEIRTPLNAIIGLGQLEMENKNVPYHCKKTMEKILMAGQNLLSIINGILDLSKIENGKFEIVAEEYDIPSLINDVCVVSRTRIASKNLEFRIFISPDIPMRFCGDMQRIKQILNNFLSNAIKYTDEGFVELSVAYAIKDGSPSLKFKVIDSGIGIKAEDIPYLFDAYNRLEIKKNRTIEGTGLGLNITKKIADLLNADIKVKSTYGLGSEFSVSIPQVIIDQTPIGNVIAENLQQMKYDAEKTAVNNNMVKTKMTGSSVLVVDDVQMNLDVIQGLLEPYDLYIATATSGQQAINLIRNKNEYDIIFMDHMMPMMDGIEATRIIRSMDSEYAKKVPIIAFTANAMSGNDKMFLEKGFNDFISKPIDVRKLDACINKWIKTGSDGNNEALADMKTLKRYIDFEEAIAQFGSETEFRKLLGSFKKHTPDLLSELRENTGSDYIVSIHALKGCARTIFVKELGDRAYELEMAAKNGDWKFVKNKNAALIRDTQKLIDAIAAY